MRNSKKMAASIIEIVIGIVLCTIYFAGRADEYWNGMGAALIAVGALRFAGEVRYRKDEKYRKSVEIETNDERNRYISLKSWAWAGYCFVFAAAAASVIFKIAGRDAMCLTAAMGACLLMILYAGFYIVLKRKY